MTRPRILCVDDDLFTLGFLSNVLTEQYDVSSCRNPEHALNLAKSLKPDLILSDLAMPTMSGQELLIAFKSDEQLKAIPFVFFTAFADTTDFDMVMAQGVRGILEKPISPTKLLEQIAYALEHPEYI